MTKIIEAGQVMSLASFLCQDFTLRVSLTR